jgi:hypothetical protein
MNDNKNKNNNKVAQNNAGSKNLEENRKKSIKIQIWKKSTKFFYIHQLQTTNKAKLAQATLLLREPKPYP